MCIDTHKYTRFKHRERFSKEGIIFQKKFDALISEMV